MKFLVDRCVGRKVSQWLENEGHDVVEARSLGPDPGDKVLLQWAESQERILITIDTDFGKLVYSEQATHCGLIRLPDVPAGRRVQLLEIVLGHYSPELERGAVVTVRGDRVRISRSKRDES